MIFVTVGTTYFDELVAEVDRLVETGVIHEKVVAQIGEGRYEPRQLEWFRYAPTLEPYYQKAARVICHGGTGTVFDLLRLGKPFVAVANRALMHDHQSDLLRALALRRWCRCCYRVQDLAATLNGAEEVRPYEPADGLGGEIWGFLLSSPQRTIGPGGPGHA